MSQVFVLDAHKQALNPIHPGRARLLLKQGKAAVYRRYPFTIILASAVEQPTLRPLRFKVDPGSRTTGIALVDDHTGEVEWAAELTHRGEQIKRDLDKRRAARRSRRRRKTRYRKSRFANRRKRTGTLPPSLDSPVCNVLTWVHRLMRLCPVTAISQELARFDTQALEQPDIEGVEYQQGTLKGYELREYILLKWSHQCAYCDAHDVPLELDHVQPRAKHGTYRVSNLTLACQSCNRIPFTSGPMTTPFQNYESASKSAGRRARSWSSHRRQMRKCISHTWMMSMIVCCLSGGVDDSLFPSSGVE
jgi:5-methylcytosine-specific restriction endonuclease McrA